MKQNLGLKENIMEINAKIVSANAERFMIKKEIKQTYEKNGIMIH
jgi:hypothetical protein